MNINIKNYKNILDNISDGVYFVDKNRKILYWNNAAEKITGFTYNDVINSFCYHNILRHVDKSGNELCRNGCPLLESMKTGTFIHADVYMHHKSSYLLPISIKVFPLKNDKNEIIGAIEIFNKQKKINNTTPSPLALKEFLMYDPLTNLPNAKYLYKVINSKLNEIKSIKRNVGILIIDIANFTSIINKHGSDIANQLLKIVAFTLKSNIKTGDIIAHWKNDKFVLIFNLENKEELNKIAIRLKMLSEKTSILIENKNISLSISIGGTYFLTNDNIEKLIDRLNNALIKSKNDKYNKIRILE
ncbi:PAS domain S-box-containing protein/diguanylate cyclase (GGDEF)-like protein [Hypnocyclicus thermotrophus]|uniref:PAS domain S-box-containing protein/diguanylate cyclase (GGDEF)-like protein n=1 Tax=Hypnocyclicus thermotrophus TaxID=1627895 RepID=A0AA46I6M3_9FUSO|nr:diguanylate cyclase [Hypnocyclicus thermotrophus]TDT72580.1 PAS domain S-box-containing protein/diguanylate cyclase (GGDEF)-like protein [Hypnocyclicus thermotrophus]